MHIYLKGEKIFNSVRQALFQVIYMATTERGKPHLLVCIFKEISFVLWVE